MNQTEQLITTAIAEVSFWDSFNLDNIFQFMLQDDILFWILLIIGLIIIYFLWKLLKEPKAILVGFILILNLLFMFLLSITMHGVTIVSDIATEKGWTWLIWMFQNSVYVYLISFGLCILIMKWHTYWTLLRRLLRF